MRRSRWLTFWTDHSDRFKYDDLDEEERRNLVLTSLDRSGFGYQIVFVAGLGFLADAYDIFSINTILPMISIIYWQNDFPDRFRLGLNLATLLGSMAGQTVLGVLADRFGRRKVYGLELAFTIVASLAFATASPGIFNSMSLIGLLIFWRLVMGIGIGSDYPLSSVLTAEFAPSKHRDSMLATVFFFQPFGQLIAVLIAFATTAGWKSHIEGVTSSQGPLSCSVAATTIAGMECARTLDRSWRLVAGLGAVPAAIAIYFRFTIPESVYYTLDVKEDHSGAADDAERYFGSTSSLEVQSMNTESSKAQSRPSDVDVTHDDANNPDMSSLANQVPPADQQLQADTENPSPGGTPIVHAKTQSGENEKSIPTQNHLQQSLSHPSEVPGTEKEDDTGNKGPEGFFPQFFHYLFSNGNYKDLFATSLSWMLLDFTFYLLGVNSSSFVPTLFGENNGPDRPPYSLLIEQERHIMESSSVGSLVGSILAIGIFHHRVKQWLPKLLNTPRKIQVWGFGALSVLFIIVGSLYITLPSTRAHVAIVFFYQLCQLFYNLGPNTTTFMIPAQVFPTKFRCTCYGISAALGKLGSVLGQVVVSEVTNNKGLGGTLIGFSLVMVAGALLSATIGPETCEKATGKSLELKDSALRLERENLASGKESTISEATP